MVPRRSIPLVLGALLGLGGVLAAPETPPPPAASAPGATLSALDRLYLTRVGEALVLSRATAGRLWPDWGLEKTPLVVYEPGRVAYLINHPAPPPDFTRLSVKLPLLGAVHYKSGRDPRFNANTSIDLGGVSTALIGFSTGASDTEGPSLRFVTLLFHEAFHALQARAGKPGKGSVEAALLRYPGLNAENMAYAQVEQMLLYRILRFGDAPDPEQVRAFLAVREARARLLGGEFIRAERGIEYQEGIPTYIEARVLEETRRAAAAAPGLGAGDPYALDFSLSAEILGTDQLMRLLRFSADTAAVRSRAYGTGMALGLLLDRLGADWKAAILSGDKYPDEILAETVPIPAGKAPEILARVRRDYAFEELQRGVQERLARLAQERKAAADSFYRQDGIQIVVQFPPGPVEVRGFDPMNLQPVDEGRTLHRRILRLAFGESSFSASGIPVLAAHGDGPLDVRGVTVFSPADKLQVESDFVPLRLEPGTREFRSSLRISGDGFTLQAAAGSLTVSPDGARLEVAIRR